jgi:hypothetical protein
VHLKILRNHLSRRSVRYPTLRSPASPTGLPPFYTLLSQLPLVKVSLLSPPPEHPLRLGGVNRCAGCRIPSARGPQCILKQAKVFYPGRPFVATEIDARIFHSHLRRCSSSAHPIRSLHVVEKWRSRAREQSDPKAPSAPQPVKASAQTVCPLA